MHHVSVCLIPLPTIPPPMIPSAKLRFLMVVGCTQKMGSLNIQFQAKIFGNIVAKGDAYIYKNFLRKKLTAWSLLGVGLMVTF